MKARNLWVAIALVFMVQGISAQKVETVKVEIESYKSFEDSLKGALMKYRVDYLKNGISAAVAEEELVIAAQTAIFEAFMADKEKVVDALLSKPVTVRVNINLKYDKSKDFPILQTAYMKEMTNFWNGFAGRGVKESLGYTPRSGETENEVTKTTITTTTTVNGVVKNVDTKTEEVQSSKQLEKKVQKTARTVSFKVSKDLEPYIDPLLNEVTKFVHQWVNTWQIK